MTKTHKHLQKRPLALQDLVQLLEPHRFGEQQINAARKRLLLRARRRQAREREYVAPRQPPFHFEGAHTAGRLEAIHDGHRYVGQDELESVGTLTDALPESLKGFQSVCGTGEPAAELFGIRHQNLQIDRVVVDQ